MLAAHCMFTSFTGLAHISGVQVCVFIFFLFLFLSKLPIIQTLSRLNAIYILVSFSPPFCSKEAHRPHSNSPDKALLFEFFCTLWCILILKDLYCGVFIFISSKMLPLSCAGSVEYALFFRKIFFKCRCFNVAGFLKVLSFTVHSDFQHLLCDFNFTLP